MKYTETANEISHIVGYEYDLINNLTALIEVINGTKYATGYTYDKDNRVTSVAGGLSTTNSDGAFAIGNATIKDYTYDGFGRVAEQVTSKYNGTYVAPEPEEDSTEPSEAATEPTEPVPDPNKETLKTDTFQFTGSTEGDNTTTSSQVSKHTITTGSGENSPVYKEFTYTYDANGNILTISDGTNTTNYTYDKANQLLREDNQAASYTHIWTYDDAGNILKREEYAYTTGVPSGDATTINYAYSNANWGDLLTSYNSQTITHDTIGNPLSDGRRTYTWEHGRQLATLTQDGVTWDFTYNADGLRTKRTNGSTTYNYVYNGSSLSQMSIVTGSGGNTATLNFVYDANGAPMAVIYNGTTYYYATNLQGDVIAILDSTGAAVVEYTYDAWGKLLDTTTDSTNSVAAALSVHNPLRYRGYVYDCETQLYYLQSRYYDPELGRFINADALAATGQGILGNNMFAYCNNNPVVESDPTGESAILAILGKAALGAAINVATTFIGAKVTGQSYSWKDAGIAALSGALGTGGTILKIAAGAVSGAYSGVMAHQNGADAWKAIVAGLTAAVGTTVSVANLAGWMGDVLSLGVATFTDFVFGIASNSIAAAAYRVSIETSIPKTEQKATSNQGGNRGPGARGVSNRVMLY